MLALLGGHQEFMPGYSQDIAMLTASGGSPDIAAFFLFYAGLFVAVRWWKLSDPLRRSRLSVFATVIAAVLAFVIPFTQPWGLFSAAIIATSVQLSSSWLSQNQKLEVRRRMLQT